MSAASRKARLWLTTIVVVWCSVLLPFQKPDHRADRPEIDPRIRFIIDGQFGIPGNRGGQFDLLDFPAGELGIHGLVEKGKGTDADPPQKSQQRCLVVRSGRYGQEIPKGDPLETRRLLKTVGDSCLWPAR